MHTSKIFPTLTPTCWCLQGLHPVIWSKVPFIILRQCCTHSSCWQRTWGDARSFIKMLISQSACTFVTLASCLKCRSNIKDRTYVNDILVASTTASPIQHLPWDDEILKLIFFLLWIISLLSSHPSQGDYRDCTLVVWSTDDYNILAASKTASPIHHLSWDPYTANEFASVGERGTVLFWLLDETQGKFSLNVHEASVPEELLVPKHNVSTSALLYRVCKTYIVYCINVKPIQNCSIFTKQKMDPIVSMCQLCCHELQYLFCNPPYICIARRTCTIFIPIAAHALISTHPFYFNT